MTKTAYLQTLLDTLLLDMRSVPLGVRQLSDVAGSIRLNKGTYVWRMASEFVNSTSYRVKLNHAASGAGGSFKFVSFDDKRTPGVADIRDQSPVMQKAAGQTSEWIFNVHQDSVFVGIEVPNDNTPIPLALEPPAGFRGLHPVWFKGPVPSQGAQLQPGTPGDLGASLPAGAVDLGERFPGLLIQPTNSFPADLVSYYHVDFASLTEAPTGLPAFCADLLQHYLANYHSGSIAFDTRAQWQLRNPQGTERQYLASLVRSLAQQPINYPVPSTVPARLSRRYRTNFIAPENFTGSGVDFAIVLLQRDLTGRNVPFQTFQQWTNAQQKLTFPESFVQMVVPLQQTSASDTPALEALRTEIATVRERLPQQHSVQLILEGLHRGFGLDRLVSQALTALSRQELGIAESALAQLEGDIAFLLHHNYAFGSRTTTSMWARSLASEDAGVLLSLRQQLPDHVRRLVRRNRGLTLMNIASVLAPGQVVVDDPLPLPMYASRVGRTAAQLDTLMRDVRTVPDVAAISGMLQALEDNTGNYTLISTAHKTVLRNAVHGVWNLLAHYMHLQLPLLWAELHRASGRHDEAKHFLEVALDDDEASAAAMVRYPFLNPVIERPAVALRLARNYREHAERLVRSMDDGARVEAEGRFIRAQRLLERAVKPDNPAAQMETAACAVGLHKIQHRLNLFGFGEDHVPLFRYQPLVSLATELAQQAIDAGRQLTVFWQQAEQATRGEIESGQAVAMSQGLAEAEALRAQEASTLVQVATLQVQQTARQIVDLTAKIRELDDPVFMYAAVGTGLLGAAAGMATGAAIGGTIGAIAGGGPIGLGVGLVAGGAAGAVIGGAQGTAQLRAHESALNDVKRSKALLEQFGTEIVAAQLEVAKSQQFIAEKMAAIARLRLAQSRQLAALLREQTFNAERFYQLAGQMWDVYRTLLGYAMRAAFLAEQALEFELNERVNVIGYEYDTPGDRFLLGAERLRSDLASLRNQRVERFAAKRQPATIAISLAEEFPLALFELRSAGRTTIRVDLGFLERLYPGAYQARISRIELAFFALTPQVGLHGTLKSSGVSFVKNEVGDTVALVVAPETQLISRYQYRDGAWYLAMPDEQLRTFEGMGTATDLTLELPAIANQLERRTIADVHVLVHFTTLYSTALEEKVVALRPATSVAMRSFSLHEVFSDAFFDLVNRGTTQVTFAPRHFPQTHRAPVIRRIMLFSLLRNDSTAETLQWRIVHKEPAGAPRQIDIVVARSNPVVDRGAGSASLQGMSVFGDWGFKGAFTDASGTSLNLGEELHDAILFVEYQHS